MRCQQYPLNSEEFLSWVWDWRAALVLELQTNARGFMQRRQPSVASSVPVDFPNVHVLDLYTNPITTFSRSTGSQLLVDTWVPRLPDPALLIFELNRIYRWDREALATNLRRFFWAAFLVKQLELVRPSRYSTAYHLLYSCRIQIRMSSRD